MKQQTFIVLMLLVVIGVVFWLLQAKQAEAPASETLGTPSEQSADRSSNSQSLELVEPSDTLIELYDGIAVPDNTEVLDLSGRGLSGSLKAEIRLLRDLERLDLSDNAFTGLPAEVGQLSRLRTLDLSNNPLTGLPHELGNLQNLQVLDLRGTEYSAYDLKLIREQLPSSTSILTDTE